MEELSMRKDRLTVFTKIFVDVMFWGCVAALLALPVQPESLLSDHPRRRQGFEEIDGWLPQEVVSGSRLNDVGRVRP